MEEKERYELNDNDCLLDNDNNIAICDFCELALFPDIVVDLLNQQDAKIKELEQENQQLKQQLHKLPKEIVEEVKDDLLDFSNGWWRYFMTDGCEYMLSSDLQGCLDEIIDTILKKYGGEDE